MIILPSTIKTTPATNFTPAVPPQYGFKEIPRVTNFSFLKALRRRMEKMVLRKKRVVKKMSVPKRYAFLYIFFFVMAGGEITL